MAQRYSIGRVSTDGTIAAPQIEIYNLTREAQVREIEIFLVAATASVLGLGRPAAIGVTPTAPVTLLGDLRTSADVRASTTKTAVAWGTAPTVPAAYIKRGSLAAAVAATLLWKFEPKELIIPVGGSLVIWNISASSAGLQVNFVVDE